VPNAPEGPVEITNIKSTECTLSWFTPLDDGGDHIQSYVIDIKEKSKNKWIQLSIVDSHKLSTKALRLVEGNVYNFRIAAKNNVGLSEYLYSNDVVTSRPHTVPDSPNQLIVSDKQANSCALEWKTPIYNGGTELTGYLIDMKTNNEWTNIAKIKADLRYFQVLNLKENQEYYFRVSCLNKIGLSKPATMSTPVILKPKIATPLMPRSPLPKPKEIPPVIKTAPPTPKPAPKPVIKPIIPEKIEIKKPIEKTLGHPGRPEGPLIITNITDTTANYIQKTIAWKPPLHDGGSPITGYLIKRIDTKRPWEKRVSANTLTIKIKELVAHSDYLVQVFAENSQGLSSALESDEPIKARISDLYIIQEIHTNELIFKYKAENPDNTIWEVIYCKRSFGSRNITRSTDNTTIQRSNKKLKYIQSKLQLN
jgi:titin